MQQLLGHRHVQTTMIYTQHSCGREGFNQGYEPVGWVGQMKFLSPRHDFFQGLFEFFDFVPDEGGFFEFQGIGGGFHFFF